MGEFSQDIVEFVAKYKKENKNQTSAIDIGQFEGEDLFILNNDYVQKIEANAAAASLADADLIVMNADYDMESVGDHFIHLHTINEQQEEESEDDDESEEDTEEMSAIFKQ